MTLATFLFKNEEFHLGIIQSLRGNMSIVRPQYLAKDLDFKPIFLE